MFKPFQILCKEYKFDKYTRILKNDPKWIRYRSYKTEQAANDAIKDIRNSISDKVYYDYPSMGNPENEALYPNIKPRITIKRYKIKMVDFDIPDVNIKQISSKPLIKNKKWWEFWN